MLFLKFSIGENVCALEAARIVEVLPLLNLTPIPGAARTTAGLFNYRGTTVQVIDLGARATGQPAVRRVSTRIILVRNRKTAALHGLIAEHVTETFERDAGDFVALDVSDAHAERIGSALPFAAVARDGAQLIYRVDIDRLTESAQRVA